MDSTLWRVAVIDSGLDPGSPTRPQESRRFVDELDSIVECEPTADPTGHGTAVAAIIGSGLRTPEFLIAQVMDAHGRATPAAVAAAVLWSAARGAQLIHLSLGVAHDRSVLAAAVSDAIAHGAVVVAATPARGTASFPALYPGVIRATGDARCGIDEVSVLDTFAGLFGACAAYAPPSGRTMRGASVGSSYLTRFVVSNFSPAMHGEAVRERLVQLGTHRGREYRGLMKSGP